MHGDAGIGHQAALGRGGEERAQETGGIQPGVLGREANHQPDRTGRGAAREGQQPAPIGPARAQPLGGKQADHEHSLRADQKGVKEVGEGAGRRHQGESRPVPRLAALAPRAQPEGTVQQVERQHAQQQIERIRPQLLAVLDCQGRGGEHQPGGPGGAPIKPAARQRPEGGQGEQAPQRGRKAQPELGAPGRAIHRAGGGQDGARDQIIQGAGGVLDEQRAPLIDGRLGHLHLAQLVVPQALGAQGVQAQRPAGQQDENGQGARGETAKRHRLSYGHGRQALSCFVLKLFFGFFVKLSVSQGRDYLSSRRRWW